VSENDKQIHEWQEKLRSSFGEAQNLLNYLTTTMDNFYYRYIETEESKELKTQILAPHIYGAVGFESNMVTALKISHTDIKKSLIEFAKSIPKSQGPKIRYQLSCEIKELTADHGHLVIMSEISWNFPEFNPKTKEAVRKTIQFEYNDLGEFRKLFALKLEEACQLFL